MFNNKTYFILSREIFSSAIWLDNPHVLKLFVYLVGNARYVKEPKKYPGFKIKRGELLTSLNNLSEANEYMERGRVQKWSRAKVGRMLKILEDQGYIKLLADTYGTHISICNYELYQDQLRYKADTSDTGANTTEHQLNTDCNASENNSKKEKKVKKDEKRVKERKTPDWLPTEAWNNYVEMRNSMKLKPTEHALDLIISKLDKFRQAGDDPEQILNNSIMNSWKGIFQLDRNGKQGGTRLSNHNDGVVEEILRKEQEKNDTRGLP